MKKNTVIFLLSILSVPVMAQSKLSPALRQQVERQHVLRGASDAPGFDAYIYIRSGEAVRRLQELGVSVGVRTDSFVTAHIPASALSDVAGLESVRYVDGAVSVSPMLDKARAAAGTDKVLSGEGLPQAYTGKGVVVGVVDAGFDYCHPAFRASDGSALRIARVWEQGYSQGTPPDGFTYGSELATSEQILSAMGDVTTNSHGTHVAAIAAGRDCGNAWGGVAPDAEIVLVSKGEETANNVNITDAVAYIFDYAEKQGKPCVVNLSLGTQVGPHDGSSSFDTTLDALQGEGRIVVGSVGNFGADPIHISTQSGQPVQTFIDFKQRVSASTAGGTVDIWGNKGGRFSVRLALVNVSSGEEVSSSETLDASVYEGGSSTYTVTSSAKGSATVTTEVNPLNGKPHALVSLNFTSKKSSCEFALILTPLDEDTEINAWADDVYVQFASNDKEDYADGDSELSLAEIGGTGKRIVSVGSYTTRADYVTEGSSLTSHLDETVGDISSFSSCGPALDGRVKPDLVAPGCFIVSAVSSNDTNISSIPLAGSLTQDGTSYSWGYMQGTSMASPFFAGTVATWLQADSQLTPERVSEIADATSHLPEGLSASEYNHWGAGSLDSYDAIKKVIETTGIESPSASPATFFTWKKGNEGSLRVLFTGTEAEAVSLYDTSGRILSSGSPEDGACEIVLSAPHLPAGVYLLRTKGKTVKIVW